MEAAEGFRRMRPEAGERSPREPGELEFPPDRSESSHLSAGILSKEEDEDSYRDSRQATGGIEEAITAAISGNFSKQTSLGERQHASPAGGSNRSKRRKDNAAVLGVPKVQNPAETSPEGLSRAEERQWSGHSESGARPLPKRGISVQHSFGI